MLNQVGLPDMEYELQFKFNNSAWYRLYFGDSTLLPVGGLASARYRFRVRAVEGNYKSKWSEVRETIVKE